MNAKRLIGVLLVTWSIGGLARAEPVRNVEDFDALRAAIAEMNEVDGELTILLKNGTYQPSDSDANLIVSISPPGRATKKIMAHPGHKPVLTGSMLWKIENARNVIIDGLTFDQSHVVHAFPEQNDHYRGGVVTIVDSHNVKVRNCIFRFSVPGTDYSNYVWMRGNINVIENCFFDSRNCDGSYVMVDVKKGFFNRHIIRYCDFYDATGGPSGQNASREFLRVGTTPRGEDGKLDTSANHADGHCRIHNNLFFGFAVNGENEIISNKSDFNMYYDNEFIHCNGFLTLRSGDRCRVYRNRFSSTQSGVRVHGGEHRIHNNYFYRLRGTNRNHGCAIALAGGNAESGGTYEKAHDCQVVFNTIIDCAKTIQFCRFAQAPEFPTNNTIANNIIYTTADAPSRYVSSSYINIDGLWPDSDEAAFMTNDFVRNLMDNEVRNATLNSDGWSFSAESQSDAAWLARKDHVHHLERGRYLPSTDSAAIDNALMGRWRFAEVRDGESHRRNAVSDIGSHEVDHTIESGLIRRPLRE